MADVRVIDANALIKHYSCVKAQKSSAEKIRAEIIVQALEKAPTIDPESLRPVGRWHLNEDGKWACTYCDGLAVEHPDEPEKWQALTRYCPNCGARMKG